MVYFVEKFEDGIWWGMKQFTKEDEAKKFKQAYEAKWYSEPYPTPVSLRMFGVEC